MTLTDTIQQTYTDVWQWRGRSAAWFVIPDTSDALAFAVTEAGEAVDAWLREIGPGKGYKRNHAKAGQMWDELGDCFFMCATALGPGCEYWNYAVGFHTTPRSLARTTKLLADAWEAFTDEQRNPITCAFAISGVRMAMFEIAALFIDNGHDLRATVQARMKRLTANHYSREAMRPKGTL